MERIKVRVRCNQCGESFILRASRDKDGSLQTGFKMCLCGNEDDIETTISSSQENRTPIILDEVGV